MTVSTYKQQTASTNCPKTIVSRDLADTQKDILIVKLKVFLKRFTKV